MSQHLDISQTEWELIERFILKDLTPEEQHSFSAKLAVDPGLQRKVKEVEIVMLGIQESVLTGKLNDFHSQMNSDSSVHQSSSKIISLRKMLAAACVLAIFAIAAAVWFNQPGKNKSLFSDYYKPDAGLISAMSTTSNYAFDKAMVDYKTGEYAKAIKQWEELLKTEPTNDTLNYFLGSAYLAGDKEDQSIVYFNKVLADSSSEFINDANWYKGLALLKQGKKEDAVEAIRKANHPGQQELLNKIKNP